MEAFTKIRLNAPSGDMALHRIGVKSRSGTKGGASLRTRAGETARAIARAGKTEGLGVKACSGKTEHFGLKERFGQAAPFVLRSRSGVSLLISIVLVAIVTVFALGVSNLVFSTLRQTANVNRSNQAFYAAEGALEAGLLQNQTRGAGYTSPAQQVTLCDTTQTGSDCPTATVAIQGTVPTATKINDKYVIPVPGTGTAGSDCSPFKPVTTPFSYVNHGTTISGVSPFDHPCNWNTLKVGESVVIPLYVTATDSSCEIPDTSAPEPGYYTCNPDKLGLKNLTIKIRTPCMDGSEMCQASERYTLKDSATAPNAPYNGDDPIVDWQITGTNQSGTETYALKPNYNEDYEIFKERWKALSYVISDKVINAKRMDGDFAVIAETYSTSTKSPKWAIDLKSQYGSIINFLLNVKGFLENTDWNTRKINKPVLKLTVVHSLENKTDSTSIPYLEYQITTNSDLKLAPTSTSQTITAEGVAGTFKQVLEVKQPQESGLLEYVIQQ